MQQRLRSLWSALSGLMVPDEGGSAAGAARPDSSPRVSPVLARARARALARQRARQLAWLVGLGLVLVSVRTAWIMLVPDERLEDKAKNLYHETVLLEARRGDLLDREGGILATSVSMPALHADPKRIAELEGDAAQLAAELAPLLGVERAWLEPRLSRSGARDVLLARELAPQAARAALRLGRAGRLFVRETSRRYYPDGLVASALLGFVDHTGVGREGLERTLNERLRGDTFQFVQTRDRTGRGLQAVAVALQAAQEGQDVVLTIDRVIQFAAERALDEVMERSEPLSAHLVAMDIRTGEILALANRPATDANDRRNLDVAGLRNHAVADAVEPGSVFKPFIVALALQAGIVTPDSMIDCEGGAWRVGRSRIRDDHAHGLVILGEVVKFSSNIGAAKLALKLGADDTMAGLKDFGFGRDPGTQMPGAVAGFLRSPSKVKAIELATTAYGQGVTSSTLQLVSAVATIANDGVRMQPYVVAEIRDEAGQVVERSEPQVEHRVVSAEVAREVSRMMVTVTERGGTGTRAAIDGYKVAGKTGTAQKVVDGRYSPTARVSTFIGFLPADRPRVAIAVVVDTPGKGSRYGGSVAGPAFKLVAESAMRHLGVPADPPEPEEEPEPVEAVAQAPEPAPTHQVAGGSPWSVRPLSDPALALQWAEDDQLRVPDLSGLGLRDVLVLFQGSGLELALSGHGRAADQLPPAGSLVSLGERVEVRFQ